MKHFFTFALLLMLAAPAIHAQLGSAKLEYELSSQLLHKTLVLRDFPAGTSLTYDEQGTLLNPRPGLWTMDSTIEITDVAIEATRIEIFGHRQIISFPNGEPRREYSRGADIVLHVRRDPVQEQQTIDALSQIFVSSTESITRIVPNYWKYFAGKVEIAEGKPSIPVPLPNNYRGEPIYSTEAGLVSPAIATSIKPSFPAAARIARKEGTVTLWVVVKVDGTVAGTQVFTPVGYGLEEEAIKCVEQWRFTPAQYQGRAVNAAVKVDVPFHLYDMPVNPHRKDRKK